MYKNDPRTRRGKLVNLDEFSTHVPSLYKSHCTRHDDPHDDYLTVRNTRTPRTKGRHRVTGEETAARDGGGGAWVKRPPDWFNVSDAKLGATQGCSQIHKLG